MYQFVNTPRQTQKQRPFLPRPKTASAQAPRPGAPSKVITVLDPPLRSRIDLATEGCFTPLHVNSVAEAYNAAKDSSVRAVLLSPTVFDQPVLPEVAKLAMKCPGVVLAALVSDGDNICADQLLKFGAWGVREAVDLSSRDGWDKLRGLVEQTGGEVGAQILGSFLPALGEPSLGCREFFCDLVRFAPTGPTVREFTDTLGLHGPTLMSRFFRAGLPSPKRYLAATRILYAAAFFETPGTSINDVTCRLKYSSPQGFGRHLRTIIGLTIGEMRREHSFASLADHFVSVLFAPHQKKFRRLEPLGRRLPGQS